jgi:uncharacterized protein (DUF2235 family)
MAAGKRIALFLDGTWNTSDDNTNVWRMKSLFASGSDQICYYSAGVGTLFGQRLIGGMWGYGLDDEVLRAYAWLIEHYDPGDRLFIFGFSRGAYTARSLAGLISKCGLLKPGAPMSVNQLYTRYRRGSKAPTILELQRKDPAGLAFEDRWLREYSMAIPIWFQGVWDTVGALGIPFGSVPLVSRSNYGFLETDLRINDTHAFHALAIDEHREAFAPTLWRRTVQQGVEAYPERPLSQVEQRWFVGAHADVGGGYPNGLLAQIPLQWLMQKACLHGLVFKGTIDIDGDECGATVHNSFAEMLHGVYRVCKFGKPFYRAIGAPAAVVGDKTTSTINETIDATVFDRWRVSQTYRPKNLATWASAHQLDIASLHDSVRAVDLAVVAPAAPTTTTPNVVQDVGAVPNRE